MASQLLSCFAYAICSMATVLLNKVLMSNFQPDMPAPIYSLVMLVFQSVFAVCIMLAVQMFGAANRVQMTKAIISTWFPVNLAFIAMLFTGFVSLGHNSVPMVTLFKNLTNVMTVCGEWIIDGQKPSMGIAGTLFLMILGAFLSAYNDLEFNAVGYLWMLANCVCTSFYILYLRHVTSNKNLKLGTTDMVFLNNILTIASGLSFIALSGHSDAVLQSRMLEQPGFWLVAIFSAITGGLLGFTSLWCVSATSATTYATVGALNKIPLVFLGNFLFSNPMTSEQAVFVSFGMLGGMLFSYVKYQERQQAKQKQKPA